MSTTQPTGDPRIHGQDVRVRLRAIEETARALLCEDLAPSPFPEIAAAFEDILKRDADTQRRLAALEANIRSVMDGLGQTFDASAGNTSRSGGLSGAASEEAPAPTSSGLTTAELDVLVERHKQRVKWGDAHDDGHYDGELALAASYLAHPDPCFVATYDWVYELGLKHNRRQQLVIASALCIAEIERLDRKEYGDTASPTASACLLGSDAGLNGGAAGESTDASPSGHGKTAAPSPLPWTAEQREAAGNVLDAAETLIDEDNRRPGSATEEEFALCAAIAKVAPLFVSPPPVPSVEECERAYKKAWEAEMPHIHSSMVTRGESAGIAAVRALFVQGDGASVPGDSGLKAGHNMERGSGCPASDHHADRETSTTQAPKEPAPSPTPAPVSHPEKPDNCPTCGLDRDGRTCPDAFHESAATPAPDREALAKAMLAANASVSTFVSPPENATTHERVIARSSADAAIAHFAPIVDALTRERDEARAEVAVQRSQADLFANSSVKSADIAVGFMGERDAARAELKEVAAAVVISADSPDPVSAHVRKLREDRDYLRGRLAEAAALLDKAIPERERLRDRVAELERKQTWGVAIEKAAQEIHAGTDDPAFCLSPSQVETILRRHLHELPEKPKTTGLKVTLAPDYMEKQIRVAISPCLPDVKVERIYRAAKAATDCVVAMSSLSVAVEHRGGTT